MLEKFKLLKNFISNLHFQFMCLLLLNIFTLIIMCNLYFYLDKYQIENRYNFLNLKLNVTFLLITCIIFNIIILFYSNSKWLKLLNIVNFSWAELLKYIYSGNETIYTKLAIYKRIRSAKERFSKLSEWLKEDGIEFPIYLKEKLVNECFNFTDLHQQYIIEKKIYLDSIIMESYAYAFYNVLSYVGLGLGLCLGLIILLKTYSAIGISDLGHLENKVSFIEHQNTVLINRINSIGELFLLTPQQIKKLVEVGLGYGYVDPDVDNLPKKFIPFSGKGNILGKN